MSWPRGIGLVLAGVYLIAATWVVRDELRHSGGGWINLRGIGTAIVTAPSQVTVGHVLRAIGVRAVNFNNPGPAGYLELIVHVLLTAALVYGVGYGLARLIGRAL